MITKEITCIECPNGCLIKASLENNEIVSLEGYQCPRGKEYAKNECICPRRVLTTTVKTIDGRMVSVKTDKPIKKDNIFIIMDRIKLIKAKNDVKIGDIIYPNIDEDINLVASSNRQ